MIPGFPKKGKRIGGGSTAVLRSSRQAGQLPCGGQSFRDHRDGEHAGGLSACICRKSWIKDGERRKKTGVPEEIQFQTKPDIALEQIRRARQRGVPQGVVLADAGYGNDTEFRMALTKMEMTYVMGVQSTVTVWKPGEEPKPAPTVQGNTGRPPQTAAARSETSTDLSQRARLVLTWPKLGRR